MGLGDDLMATAQARVVHEATGHKVSFGYWSEVFENNPRIAREGRAIELNNRPGRRPYILGQTDRRFVFNPNYRAVPGEIWLGDDERDWLGDKPPGFVLIEPHVKEKVSGRNKAWPWENWQALVNRAGARKFVQPSYGKSLLDGVSSFKVESFRQACALLSRAGMLITTDGGLHHAAAALDRPAIVLWGHYSSPGILGYPQHINIWDETGPCGSLDPCSKCETAMNAISVDRVLDELLQR